MQPIYETQKHQPSIYGKITIKKVARENTQCSMTIIIICQTRPFAWWWWMRSKQQNSCNNTNDKHKNSIYIYSAIIYRYAWISLLIQRKNKHKWHEQCSVCMCACVCVRGCQMPCHSVARKHHHYSRHAWSGQMNASEKRLFPLFRWRTNSSSRRTDSNAFWYVYVREPWRKFFSLPINWVSVRKRKWKIKKLKWKMTKYAAMPRTPRNANEAWWNVCQQKFCHTNNVNGRENNERNDVMKTVYLWMNM